MLTFPPIADKYLKRSRVVASRIMGGVGLAKKRKSEMALKNPRGKDRKEEMVA